MIKIQNTCKYHINQDNEAFSLKDKKADIFCVFLMVAIIAILMFMSNLKGEQIV